MINHYGQLLFDAIRETLETMAFAEVVPYSFQIGNEEFSCMNEESEPADFSVDDSGIHAPVQTDFESTNSVDSAQPSGTWGVAGGTLPVEVSEEGWGEVSKVEEAGATEGAWGMTPHEETVPVAEDWGGVSSLAPDPWGGGGVKANSFVMKAHDFDFKKLVDNQEDWCWSCMRVNSAEIHSIWFIISKALALELAKNMYAGEEEPSLDSPLIRDLIAELTNVLGGRLMLLLEEMGAGFTLTVPDIGIGLPKMPDSTVMESVLCKVLVDGEYPVMSSICFNKTED
ncbi:MAG: chemotaxis protein CheX [Thermoguttaceae bacterium]